MFVVANCLGGVIEAGIQVEMYFLTATLFSILKIISEHTSYFRAGGGKIELVRPLTIMLKLLLYTCQ